MISQNQQHLLNYAKQQLQTSHSQESRQYSNSDHNTNQFNNQQPSKNENIQNSVIKLRNFFSQLINLTLQKHTPALSEHVKQSICKVIVISFSHSP